ncbi:hypothetical protein AA23498_1998 [Acetobacter nitrogenifigens DSM 23921 = NBRC 105050]|nr:hypothetical protein AA23498_1998 [Acetobacter nitrogenifigens DSM 23921 = NBRC 105050]
MAIEPRPDSPRISEQFRAGVADRRREIRRGRRKRHAGWQNIGDQGRTGCNRVRHWRDKAERRNDQKAAKTCAYFA